MQEENEQLLQEDIRIQKKELKVKYQENSRLLREQEIDMHLQKKESEFNTYATTKSVSQELLNTSTIQSHIGLIITLSISNIDETMDWFEIWLLALLILSLVLQFLMFVLLVMLAKTTTDNVTKNCSATACNNAVTALSGLGLIINISITALTIKVMEGNMTRLATKLTIRLKQ